jgi:metalloendopeptidase OMA1, mitochondrial
MVSDRQMIAMADKSHASFMSMLAQKNAIASSSESPKAASTIAAVQRVSDRIIDAAGLRGKLQWETTLVKSKTANAMVLPNGKITVFTGLLPIVKNEAGLAAVLGHEVAHVVARHSAERLSQKLLASTVVAAADAYASAKNSSNAAAVSAAIGLGAQYGVLLPFSREHESEADRIGLIFMAKAGYDPAEAIGVWERMEQAGGGGRWEFLSTHPSPSTRRAQIRAWLPEANLYYADRNRPLPTNLAERGKPEPAPTGSHGLTNN